STTKVSLVKRTSPTRSSALSAKMPMPCLQQTRLIFCHQLLNPPQFFGGKAVVPRQSRRLQPKLSRLIVPVHMNMRRLDRFMAVETKPIMAAAQHVRHISAVSNSIETALHPSHGTYMNSLQFSSTRQALARPWRLA